MSAHGYSRYTRGCRCEVCVAAKAAYMRRKRAAARAYVKGSLVSEQGRNYIPETSHGSYGYKERHCRCEVCTEAKRLEYQRRRDRLADTG